MPNIDWEELINNALSIYGEKATIKNAAQEQYKELNELYITLDRYYKQVKNQEIKKEVK